MFGQTAANPYTGSLGTLSRCLSAIVSCQKKYGETCRSESVREGTRELYIHPYFLLRQLNDGVASICENVAELLEFASLCATRG